MVEQVTSQLALDAAQKAQVDKLVAASADQRRAAFQISGGDRAAMASAMRKANDQLFTDIEAVLKPDQKTKMAALRAEMSQRGPGGQAAQPRVERTVYVLRDKKPEAVKVMTGPNDGTWIAIYGDSLKVGDEVITGGGTPVKAGAQTARPATGFGGAGSGFGGGGFGGGGPPR